MKREKIFPGTLNPEISEREKNNRTVARKAAAEGIVLLKNDDGALPLPKGQKLALFGSGAGRTVKGGIGSGDVNERECVSIYQGLLNAGYQIESEAWIADFEKTYEKSRAEWKADILDSAGGTDSINFFEAYSARPFRMPAGRDITADDIGEAETAVYVISRISGEGADRYEKEGDYYLTLKEKEDIVFLTENCSNVIVVINTGGQIDMEYILERPNVKAVLFVSQMGMEGGNALADILSGAVTPSGKLTATWAKKYADFPNAAIFSHNNGDVDNEKYVEGIYVGYRYFDSFGIPVRYPFGYGLSYTSFEINGTGMKASDDGKAVWLDVQVKNSGESYAGKEVVQVYLSCPQGRIPKEQKKLCTFAKTKCLQPQEVQKIQLTFSTRELAVFDEEKHAWVIEEGIYGVWIGNSAAHVKLAGLLRVEEENEMEKLNPVCPLQKELQEIIRPQEWADAFEKNYLEKGKEFVPVLIKPAFEKKMPAVKQKLVEKAQNIVKQLSERELTAMVIGSVSKGQDNAFGASGVMVPGSAGETSSVLEEKWDVPGVVMADGPAGLRLVNHYEADRTSGVLYNPGMLGAMEGGYFMEEEHHENADVYYQYCTAMPVGTLLAQTWNTEMLQEVGRAVAEEMQEFGISWWLAPGMNIQRNPLCGRNYEYYSEDPLLSGIMAAAITRGVQSIPGVGTTIKHFTCNNQEDNRMGSDSIVSERALRELYLKGFEIAVKTAQPMAIMTSYNLLNGVHTANSTDLCTIVAREEWGFAGIIMTDWTTTLPAGGSTPWKCVKAGNDLIMPGFPGDSEDIERALKAGWINREDLEKCVQRLLVIIFQTLEYEDCEAYSSDKDMGFSY